MIRGQSHHQLLRAQTPKAQKKTAKSSSFFALSGSASIKAARRTLVKLTPAVVEALCRSLLRDRGFNFHGYLKRNNRGYNRSTRGNKLARFVNENAFFCSALKGLEVVLLQELSLGQFHQHSEAQLYALRSQKRKKTVKSTVEKKMTDLLFCCT